MILVTGATGLVGSHLVYKLVSEGNQVRAIYRSEKKLDAVKDVFAYYNSNFKALFSKIDWVQADITDIPSLDKAFKDVTQVYHLAAFISFNPKHFERLKKINVEGTANMVNLSLAKGIKKFCYVSSIATLGETLNPDTLITEKTTFNPEESSNVYSLTKYLAELEVWRGAQEGLKTVIVHPGVILGAGHYNSASGSIIKSAYKGIRYYTSGGVGIVDVEDVVKAMILLVKSNITNDNFILVGKNITYKDLLTQLTKNLNPEASLKPISKTILTLFSYLDYLKHKLFGSKRRLLLATVKSLYTTSFYDSSKIKDAILFEFTPFEETSQKIATHFLKTYAQK
jgi:nucleoside-diphosphate-sugar epimerase